MTIANTGNDSWMERSISGQWITVRVRKRDCHVRSYYDKSKLDFRASEDRPVNSKETLRHTKKLNLRSRSGDFGLKDTGLDDTVCYPKSEDIEYTVSKSGHPLLNHLSIFVVLIGAFWWFILEGLPIETKHQLGVSSLLCFLAFIRLKRIIAQESLLAVGTLGVQISQTNVFGTMCSVHFIPKAELKAIIINETIRRYRVISYLAVLFHVPDTNDRLILPVFAETLPRLKTLERIYTELQNNVFQ